MPAQVQNEKSSDKCSQFSMNTEKNHTWRACKVKKWLRLTTCYKEKIWNR